MDAQMREGLHDGRRELRAGNAQTDVPSGEQKIALVEHVGALSRRGRERCLHIAESLSWGHCGHFLFFLWLHAQAAATSLPLLTTKHGTNSIKEDIAPVRIGTGALRAG
jgi:hypothetical protein